MKTIFGLLTFVLCVSQAHATSSGLEFCEQQPGFVDAMMCKSNAQSPSQLSNYVTVCILKTASSESALLKFIQLRNGKLVETGLLQIAPGEFSYQLSLTPSFTSEPFGINFPKCLNPHVGGGAGASIGN